RLTAARANHLLSVRVIHSPSVARGSVPGFHAGAVSSRNFAETYSSFSGSLIRNRSSFEGGSTVTLLPSNRGPGRREKNAAYCQNCSRLQEPPERSAWHWAHSSRTPRNTRAVAPATFSGLFS